MADTHAIVDALKKLLKTRGLTYAAVAQRIGLSEASMKRLFAEETFSLLRLGQLCDVLEIDFFDLAKLARGRSEVVREMSEAQEAALAADAKLLGVFYLLLSDWSAADILAGYVIEPPELTRLLVRLDRLALIELLPGDRIRLKVPKHVRLRFGGPIQRRHGKRVLDEFIAAEFDRVGGHFRFEYRELSKTSFALLTRRLERVTAEFLEFAELDASLPARRRESVGLVVAMRPWALSLVTGLTPRKS
ncbi:MAG TPA: helix-turn-helix transcriptional regulator [Casimicrobiaceae bacterium]|nr:helix-turn-helix transcriptional regulator [Casimicrobiaceae bacterium]